ncbi:MAG: colicin transporter [Rhodospirillales bacterium]|nr:colicin transporter [Rhodospirillales bacterium]MCB9995418.1 colicin transporter [Rhodospirillales bacterium]
MDIKSIMRNITPSVSVMVVGLVGAYFVYNVYFSDRVATDYAGFEPAAGEEVMAEAAAEHAEEAHDAMEAAHDMAEEATDAAEHAMEAAEEATEAAEHAEDMAEEAHDAAEAAEEHAEDAAEAAVEEAVEEMESAH